jgi:hypothetical protein
MDGILPCYAERLAEADPVLSDDHDGESRDRSE